MSKTYTHTEKITKREQWRECALKMLKQQMTPEEVEEFKHVLAASYDCDATSISYVFTRIPQDIDDPDANTHLIVHYRIRYENDVHKEIFSIKVPIPESVRRMAENIETIRTGPTVTEVTNTKKPLGTKKPPTKRKTNK